MKKQSQPPSQNVYNTKHVCATCDEEEEEEDEEEEEEGNNEIEEEKMVSVYEEQVGTN